MAEEKRHSDVDDVDIDDKVQKAVHDGPLKADELEEPGQSAGKQGKASPASGSTITGTNDPQD